MDGPPQLSSAEISFNLSICLYVHAPLLTLQLRLTLWHRLCNGSRNLKPHVGPVFQEKTGASGGFVDDGHRIRARHLLQRLPRGIRVSC